MRFDSRAFLKSLSPQMMAKAVQTFDRATTVVVSVCWAAALLMVVFAIYTLSLSVSTRREAEMATAVEPNIPKIAHKPMDPRSAQMVIDRMQRRFADINFALRGSNIMVSANDGGKFRQWLTALSYMDTVSPEFRWSIQDFCVGKCTGNELMRTVLTGERITFEAQQPKGKN
ncbi:MAG: hypothetical protein SFW62_00570 [Alphaproteobacteria bacterium]|nr:hypothetical protein [Alphaproteobacteria bacterium]